MKYRVIEYEDIEKGIPYDFINEKSDHQQDFKIGVFEEVLRGSYYPTNKKSYIFLKLQESPEAVIKNCVHESEHAAIDHCSDWEDDEMDDGILDDKYVFYKDEIIEHWVMQKIEWIDEFIPY